jgi:hypothetical protein
MCSRQSAATPIRGNHGISETLDMASKKDEYLSETFRLLGERRALPVPRPYTPGQVTKGAEISTRIRWRLDQVYVGE